MGGVRRRSIWQIVSAFLALDDEPIVKVYSMHLGLLFRNLSPVHTIIATFSRAVGGVWRWYKGQSFGIIIWQEAKIEEKFA